MKLKVWWVSHTRSGGAEVGSVEQPDNDDNVELEKSNVLLMGPTGSGKFPLIYFHFHVATFVKKGISLFASL